MTSYPFSQELILKMALPVIGRLGHLAGEREIAECWRRSLALATERGKAGTALGKLLGSFKANPFPEEIIQKASETHLEAILGKIMGESLPCPKTRNSAEKWHHVALLDILRQTKYGGSEYVRRAH